MFLPKDCSTSRAIQNMSASRSFRASARRLKPAETRWKSCCKGEIRKSTATWPGATYPYWPRGWRAKHPGRVWACPPFTTAGGTRAKGGLLQDIDIGGIDLGPFDPNVHLPDLGQLLDPAFWTGSVSLPAAGAAPIRIAVREYERFYTDEAVTEARAGARRQRRIVEERMVYCVFYVFCSLEQAVASISINQPGFTMAATCMTVRDGKLRSWSRKYSV